MRVGLISMAETVEGDPASARAFIRLGGSPLAEHQAAQALKLGCKRIILIGEEISGQLLALQRQIEDAGAEVRVIRNPEALALHTADDDELLMFGEGFHVSNQALGRMLPVTEKGVIGQALAVVASEPGLADRFERIDINHLWAGLALMPAAIAKKLPDIPNDWNLISALLRVAAQHNLAMHRLPVDLIARGELAILRDDEDADALEPLWLKQQLGEAEGIGPGHRIKRWLAQKAGPVLLHDGHSAVPLVSGAMAFTLLAAGASWLDVPGVAFLLCGLAWLTGGCAELVERLDQGRIRSTPRLAQLCTRNTVNAVIDILFVGIGMFAMLTGGYPVSSGVAYVLLGLPLLTVGLIRLSSGRFAQNVAAVASGILGDRLCWSLLFAAAAFAQMLPSAMIASCIGMVIWWLLLEQRIAKFGKRA